VSDVKNYSSNTVENVYDNIRTGSLDAKPGHLSKTFSRRIIRVRVYTTRNENDRQGKSGGDVLRMYYAHGVTADDRLGRRVASSVNGKTYYRESLVRTALAGTSAGDLVDSSAVQECRQTHDLPPLLVADDRSRGSAPSIRLPLKPLKTDDRPIRTWRLRSMYGRFRAPSSSRINNR